MELNKISAFTVVLSFLLSLFLGCSPLNIRDTVKQNNAESVRKFLKEGVDVNAKYENDLTLLHYATTNITKKITKVDYLSSQSARLHYGDDNIDIIKLLVEAGANVNARDKNDNTPLNYCYLLQAQECIKYLESCETNCRDKINRGELTKQGTGLEDCLRGCQKEGDTLRKEEDARREARKKGERALCEWECHNMFAKKQLKEGITEEDCINRLCR